ncbi:uncharacterized protein LOC141909331 [Tubulanus polymorphus]|uniref:uncharacterized protein LOC141909331 n=1 Tax=Tubulanus polymorphus TaxID=672921 RepID=UPI003DA31F30
MDKKLGRKRKIHLRRYLLVTVRPKMKGMIFNKLQKKNNAPRRRQELGAFNREMTETVRSPQLEPSDNYNQVTLANNRFADIFTTLNQEQQIGDETSSLILQQQPPQQNSYIVPNVAQPQPATVKPSSSSDNDKAELERLKAQFTKLWHEYQDALKRNVYMLTQQNRLCMDMATLNAQQEMNPSVTNMLSIEEIQIKMRTNNEEIQKLKPVIDELKAEVSISHKMIQKLELKLEMAGKPIPALLSMTLPEQPALMKKKRKSEDKNVGPKHKKRHSDRSSRPSAAQGTSREHTRFSSNSNNRNSNNKVAAADGSTNARSGDDRDSADIAADDLKVTVGRGGRFVTKDEEETASNPGRLRKNHCSTCEADFYGNFETHRFTPKHVELLKILLRKGCKYCGVQSFKNHHFFKDHETSKEHQENVRKATEEAVTGISNAKNNNQPKKERKGTNSELTNQNSNKDTRSVPEAAASKSQQKPDEPVVQPSAHTSKDNQHQQQVDSNKSVVSDQTTIVLMPVDTSTPVIQQNDDRSVIKKQDSAPCRRLIKRSTPGAKKSAKSKRKDVLITKITGPEPKAPVEVVELDTSTNAADSTSRGNNRTIVMPHQPTSESSAPEAGNDTCDEDREEKPCVDQLLATVTSTISTPAHDSVQGGPIGQEFIVPVQGYFCKLCHKFYNNEQTAKIDHCMLKKHYENLQAYIAKQLRPSMSMSVTMTDSRMMDTSIQECRESSQADAHQSVDQNSHYVTVKDEMNKSHENVSQSTTTVALQLVTPATDNTDSASTEITELADAGAPMDTEEAFDEADDGDDDERILDSDNDENNDQQEKDEDSTTAADTDEKTDSDERGQGESQRVDDLNTNPMEDDELLDYDDDMGEFENDSLLNNTDGEKKDKGNDEDNNNDDDDDEDEREPRYEKRNSEKSELEPRQNAFKRLGKWNNNRGNPGRGNGRGRQDMRWRTQAYNGPVRVHGQPLMRPHYVPSSPFMPLPFNGYNNNSFNYR